MRKLICKAFNNIKPFGLVLHRKSDWNTTGHRMQVYEKLITSYTSLNNLEPPSYSCIIFSKDRALQLHSLLCSFREMVKTPVKLYVLYASSSKNHSNAYNQLFGVHQPYLKQVIRQINFRDQVLELLRGIDTSRLFFLVDDIVITREISLDCFAELSSHAFVPSLRMAPHLQYCYTMGQEQPVPANVKGIILNEDLFCWRWSEGRFDWNYPLSLDGHIFDTIEIKTIIENCSFKAPNSLENSLQKFKSIFLHRLGVCWNEARIINIPLNKVQFEIENICGNIHQDQLLDTWEKGFAIDHKKLLNFKNRSAHQEIAVTLISRTNI